MDWKTRSGGAVTAGAFFFRSDWARIAGTNARANTAAQTNRFMGLILSLPLLRTNEGGQGWGENSPKWFAPGTLEPMGTSNIEHRTSNAEGTGAQRHPLR